MPLHTSIQALWHLGSKNTFISQIVGQLSNLFVVMDSIIQEQELTSNPFDIEEDIPSIPKGKRGDQSLQDNFGWERERLVAATVPSFQVSPLEVIACCCRKPSVQSKRPPVTSAMI